MFIQVATFIQGATYIPDSRVGFEINVFIRSMVPNKEVVMGKKHQI